MVLVLSSLEHRQSMKVDTRTLTFRLDSWSISSFIKKALIATTLSGPKANTILHLQSSQLQVSWSTFRYSTHDEAIPLEDPPSSLLDHARRGTGKEGTVKPVGVFIDTVIYTVNLIK